MAVASKFGNLLKRSVTSSPSMFNSIRCMCTSKILFVGGTARKTDDSSLRDAFSNHGYVVEAKIIVDPETGKSRGFGFVTYNTPEEAENAMHHLDNKDLDGRKITVMEAKVRTGSRFGGG